MIFRFWFIGVVVVRYVIGGIMLLAILPRVACRCFVALLREQPISVFECDYMGSHSKAIHHRVLKVNSSALPDFDKWLHYLRGHYNLIGPKPLTVNEAEKLPSRFRDRFSVAPGLLSPYSVKQKAGIAYVSEKQVSCEFAQSSSAVYRAQLLFVFLFQGLVGGRRKAVLRSRSKFSLFGVTLDNVTMSDALDQVESSLNVMSTEKSARFAFVNADCANHYYGDDGYKRILNGFDAVFADGIGVKLAARWNGVNMRANVNGTDMFPLLCERLQKSGQSLYLLGAEPHVVHQLVRNLHVHYPDLNIAGYCDGYRYSNTPQTVVNLINNSNADLLLVAMGAPRQEQWINDHMPNLNVKAAMGVGGLFDFYSGEVSRAPELFRVLSMEWVWRLFAQPQAKAKRYLVGNPLFISRVLYKILQKKIDKQVGSFEGTT